MPYLVVESLKHGLDVRKSVLTSVPGTMEIAENVHINEGGEAQKRKAFVKSANLYPVGTFGIQATDNGLETYGSIATPANLPTGAVYVRLQHPAVLAGTVYNGTYHAMIAVTMSDNFNGKGFVIAQFADTRKFCYYDGVLVQDSANGIVTEGATDRTSLGIALGLDVNAIDGWLAEVNQLADGTPKAGSDIVFSPAGVTFTPTPILSSAAGLLNVYNRNVNNNGIGLVQAQTSFTLSGVPAVGDVISITGPTTPTSGDSVVLAGANITSSPPTLDHLGDIFAQSINNDFSNIGYTATYDSVGHTLTVIAPIWWTGAQANGIAIVVTYTNVGTHFAVGPTFYGPLAVTLSSYESTVQFLNPYHLPATLYAPEIAARPTQGSGMGYTFAWSKVSGDAGITITNPTGASTAFYASLGPGSTLQAIYKCTVDDSVGNGPLDSLYLTVTITLR